MKASINYALKRELYNARKNQVLHCISGLVELGMKHKETISLAYSMGCDFNDNGYQLPGFYWERIL